MKKVLMPLHNQVLVRRIHKGEQTTSGGIVIPEKKQSQDQPERGVVVAVSEGRRSPQTGELIPLSVAVGDEVYFSKYAGHEVEENGEKLVFFEEHQIMAKYVEVAD